MIFGDLFLTEIRSYRESQLAGTGVTPVFPIWTSDTDRLAEMMLDSGVRAMVACVDPNQLDPSFAGRQFDSAMLENLPPGVDRCGENGEFHTFAYDGGAFDQPIAVYCAGTVERDGFVFADLRPGA
jgi:diphthamide synthase (EF-2-diphthine--ammonia ligase)